MDIKNIIKEEIDDFEWIRDIMSDPLSVGNLIFISPLGTNVVEWHHNDRNNPENYIILRIIDMDDNTVYYDDIVTTLGNNDNAKQTDMPNARRIIKSGYWRILDSNTPRELLTKITRSKYLLPYVIYDGNKM